MADVERGPRRPQQPQLPSEQQPFGGGINKPELHPPEVEAGIPEGPFPQDTLEVFNSLRDQYLASLTPGEVEWRRSWDDFQHDIENQEELTKKLEAARETLGYENLSELFTSVTLRLFFSNFDDKARHASNEPSPRIGPGHFLKSALHPREHGKGTGLYHAAIRHLITEWKKQGLF